MIPIHVPIEIAHGNASKAILLEIGHVFAQSFWRRMYPRMRDIRRAMKLQNDNLTVGRAGNDFLQMLECPVRISIPSRWDQQGMLLFRIVSCADFELAVRRFGHLASSSEFETQFA